MGLLNNLIGGLDIQPLLIKSESVQRLIIRGLVPPEPLTDTILNGIRNIIDVIVFLSKIIISGNSNDLHRQIIECDE